MIIKQLGAGACATVSAHQLRTEVGRGSKMYIRFGSGTCTAPVAQTSRALDTPAPGQYILAAPSPHCAQWIVCRIGATEVVHPDFVAVAMSGAQGLPHAVAEVCCSEARKCRQQGMPSSRSLICMACCPAFVCCVLSEGLLSQCMCLAYVVH